MGDFAQWSLNLGRWRGVQVRLHGLFLLFGVFVLFLSSRDPAADMAAYGALSLAILLVSVLAHEVGHAVMASRFGGNVRQIVIGPLGGLAEPAILREPQHELLSSIAGPLVNLLIWALVGPLLFAAGENVVGLLHPLAPQAVIEGEWWLCVLKLTFWINWVLVLVNLLPVFPLDGGRVLRALLWPAVGYQRAAVSVAFGAKVTALALCIAAWFVRGYPSALVPPWVALALLAIFLFFGARQEEHRIAEDEDEEQLDYDFSQGYLSLERRDDEEEPASPTLLRRWLDERRQAREQRRRQLEEDEERQVDAILARLHEVGLGGLSSHERALLERVSARYRNRQRS